jgi:hypothetical protein
MYISAVRDLESARMIWLKGCLFVLLGLMASAWLLAEHPSLQTAAFLAIAIWAFCRAYYCAFYVITIYVDPTFRYSGLGSFLRYLLARRRK